MHKFLTSMAAAASMAIAAPAMAEPITLDSGDVGTTFEIDLNGFSGDSTNIIDNLTSTLIFTLDSVSGDRYDFSYTVDNTTDGGLTSRISSFAFNVDPDISGASATGDYSFAFVADGNANDPTLPNQIGAVDVCFKAAQGGSCSNQGGVEQGESGSGTLSLFFDPDASQITLSDFFVRYQGIGGAGAVTSATGGHTSTSGTPVPAPGMLGLLALALVSLGFARRRRRPDVGMRGMPAYA